MNRQNIATQSNTNLPDASSSSSDDDGVKVINFEDEEYVPGSINTAWDSTLIVKVFDSNDKSWKFLHCGGVLATQDHTKV